MPRPAILGTAHVAADFTTSEAVHQARRTRAAVSAGLDFSANPTGSDDGESFEPYPAGTLVGTTAKAQKNRRATRSAGRKSREALTVRPARREASYAVAATARS
jgi:hypothetical protein